MWAVDEVQNLTGTPFRPISIESWPTKNQSKLTVDKITLKYGLYRATYKISLLVGPEMYLSNSELTFFEIVSVSLFLNLSITIIHNQTFFSWVFSKYLTYKN